MRQKCIFFVIYLFFVAYACLAAPPTEPSTNLNMTGTQGNIISLSFSKGNGDRRIAILKLGSEVTFSPVNATNYLASNTFGNGVEVAPGEFVVYSGTGSSFSINGLIPFTEYFITIFEYNGTGLDAEFLTSEKLTGSAFTLTAPVVQPSNIAVSNVTGNGMTISWDQGDGAASMVLMKEGAPVDANPVELISYRAQDNYAQTGTNAGDIIGNGNYVVYKGAGGNVTITNLDPSITYHIAIFEYNGSTGPVYLVTNPPRISATTLPEPSVAASALTAAAPEGDVITLRWTRGNGTRRVVLARESLPIEDIPVNGTIYNTHINFEISPELSPGHKLVYNGAGNNTTITGLKPDSIYHFAVFEYSGSGSRVAYLTSTYPAISQGTQTTPSVGVSVLDTNFVSPSLVSIKMTPGNGQGRLVVYKFDEPVDFVPINLSTYSNTNVFNNNHNGNLLAYRGGASSFNLVVPPNRKIYFAAFEYNGNNKKVFNTTEVPVLFVQTPPPPPPFTPSFNLRFGEIEGNRLRALWSRGDGSRCMVIVRKDTAVDAVPENGVQYAAENSFTLAPEISPGQKVVYDGTGSNVIIDSLEIGTRYFVKIFEYNGTQEITSYLATPNLFGSQSTLSAPVFPSSNLRFELLSLDKLKLIFKPGNGTRRLIVAKEGGPVNAVPEDLKAYNANSNFGLGSRIGDNNYVVFAQTFQFGDGNDNDTVSVDVSRLTAGETYHFAIFEYAGVQAPVYQKNNPARGNFSITFEPFVAPFNFQVTNTEGNSMSLNWKRGNGDRRIIVAREGKPVDAIPVDGIAYLPNDDFKIAPEIAPGQRVVYDGTGISEIVYGLNPDTHYYFKIFEYGGTGADIDYLTADFDETDSTTLVPPAIPVSNLLFSALTPGSVTVSWTNGNGDRRMVIARERFETDRQPNDTTNYNWSNSFGNRGHLGNGNYVVYKGTGSNFNLTSLKSGTTYFLDVYEYNGNTGPMLLRPPVKGQITTLGPPQIQAVIDSASEITHTSMRLFFSPGSGMERIVLMKKADPVNAEPQDDLNYVDNTFFGSGAQLGTGNFVMYKGTDDNTIITNLEPSTNYHFAIFEYNIFSSGDIVNYLRPSDALAVYSTLGSPLPVKFIQFSGKRNPQHTFLQWTTATEQNNDYFLVERSADGINYKEVASVEGSNYSINEKIYTVYDKLSPQNELEALPLFYRIKQVDKDNRFSYSKVIKLNPVWRSAITVAPNPVRQGQTINIHLAIDGTAHLELIDQTGRILKTSVMQNGINTISTQQLSKGYYWISVKGQQGIIKIVPIIIQ